jgi:hypothetical protein
MSKLKIEGETIAFHEGPWTQAHGFCVKWVSFEEESYPMLSPDYITDEKERTMFLEIQIAGIMHTHLAKKKARETDE